VRSGRSDELRASRLLYTKRTGWPSMLMKRSCTFWLPVCTIIASAILFATTRAPQAVAALASSSSSSSSSTPPPTNTATPAATTSSNTCPAAEGVMTPNLRSVRKILPRPPAHWVGDGFRVYPVFSNLAFTEELSPLLMFDYGEPKTFAAKPVGTPPLGVGQHPHRGFETVTIAFQGEVEHHDSTGKSGVIQKGDVQWMTAGRGIIHQEYHSKDFTKNGGVFEMCQLWVNLPQKHKMAKPGYQAIKSENIPVVNLPFVGAVTSAQDAGDNNDTPTILGTARIIAGEFGHVKGAAETYSPVQMWDVTLPNAGSEVDLPFPANHSCVVFVRRGTVEIISGDRDKNKATKSVLSPQEVALMRMDGGDTLRVRVVEPDSSLLILGGEPLGEPIAAQGPFVMNTQDELRQAMSDYRLGKMGR
jgi:quercetin 2,3-dioxygenase